MHQYYHGFQNDENRQFNIPFFNPFIYPQWNQPGQFPGVTGQGQYPSPSPQYPGQGQFPNQSGQFSDFFGQQPGHGGPSGGQSASAPQTPPPPFIPEQSNIQTKAIDPGAIRGCLYRFTYVWLDRESFWFYPIFVGRNSVSGFRWSRFRWVYFGIDLNRIQSFQCY